MWRPGELNFGEVKVLRYSPPQWNQALHKRKVWYYLVELVYSMGISMNKYAIRIMSTIQLFPANF